MSSIVDLPSQTSYAKNPISFLQELCVKYQLPLPRYNELEPTGPPHSRTFRISVNVGEEYSEGVGFTKKQAKANAASCMFAKLSSNGLVSPPEPRNKAFALVAEIVKSPASPVLTPKAVFTDARPSYIQPKNFLFYQPTSVTKLPLLPKTNDSFGDSTIDARPNPFNPYISRTTSPPQDLIPTQVLQITRAEKQPPSQTPSPPADRDVPSPSSSLKSSTTTRCLQITETGTSSTSMIQEMQTKNPVSLLQEVCAKHGFKLPVYVDKDADGPSHNRIFTIQVTAAGYTAEGTASTKKEAKRKAAERALISLEQTIQTIVNSQRVA